MSRFGLLHLILCRIFRKAFNKCFDNCPSTIENCEKPPIPHCTVAAPDVCHLYAYGFVFDQVHKTYYIITLI